MAQPTPSVRVCKKCRECKALKHFYRHRNECRTCILKRVRAWVRANPDKRKATARAWYANNREGALRSYKEQRRRRRGYWLAAAARVRARKRGIPFDLDFNEIQRRIDAGKCEVSGLPFDLSARERAWNVPSLDQINPGAGYTKDNVRVVIFGLNLLMGEWGIERGLEIARAVERRRLARAHGLEAA